MDKNWGYSDSGNTTTSGTGRMYTCDAENRQVSATVNGNTSNYVYDADGRRVQKTVAGVATVFVYDPLGQLEQEYGMPTDTGTKYVYSDALGSTRLETDASGTPTRCYDYLPFGEEIGIGTAGRTSGCFGGSLYPMPPDSVSMKFTGKERDSESGLDYFGARYYGSALGRWTSPDPGNAGARVVDPQRWNMYAYGLNNPFRYLDPTGTDPDDDGPYDNKNYLRHKLQEATQYVKNVVDYAVSALFYDRTTADSWTSAQGSGYQWIDPHGAVKGALEQTGHGLDVLTTVLSVVTPLPGEGGVIKVGTVLTKMIETAEGRLVLQFTVTEVSGNTIKGIPALIPEARILAKTNPGPAAIKAAFDSLKVDLKAAGMEQVEMKWLQMSPTAVKTLTITLR